MFSLLSIFLLWLVSIGIFVSTEEETFYFQNRLTIIIILTIITTLLFIFRKEKNPNLQKRVVTIFNLFLVSFICVHFQRFIDLLVFKDNIYRAEIYSNHYVTLRSAALCFMGYTSLLLGYTLKGQVYKEKEKQKTINFSPFSVQMFNLIYAFVVILFLYFNARNYLTGTYSQEMMELTKGTMSTFSVIFLNCSMCSITILVGIKHRLNNFDLSFSKYVKSFSPIYYICSGIYLFFCLVLGDRGPIISFLLIFYFGYVLATRKKISIISSMIVLMIASIFLNFIGLSRNNQEGGTFTQYGNEIMDIQSISPLTSELASSNRTIIYAVESTPNKYPYRYGLFTYNNIMSIIPFSQSIKKLFGVNPNLSLPYAHSSQFLTWYEQGPNQTSGVGSSTIADIYLDFGPFGCVVVLFLLGLLFRNLDSLLFSSNPQSLSLLSCIACCVFFSQAIYLPRAMIVPAFRTIVWTYIFMWMVLLFSRKRL